ncbi:MAG: hypothetical protein O9282_01510 [Flavobacterium sp.]|jgi:hypothetical protein|uniref:hypothetical protein n=1 Tax=Flavobacterium sp. TaxID=239 RepID=UPI0022BF4171|nr:hypothetical protein [Flavobacterium sp.]MCZ8329969.1 hypothetical protein [Flavobacterium sp.]
MFQGEIFIPGKKPFLNLTLSEKLNWGSLLSAFIYAFIFLADEKWNSSEITLYVKEYTVLNQIFGVIFGITFITSILIRFKEFENLNGELKGKLIIDRNGLTINDELYEASKIINFKINMIDYYGQKTNYSKSGPYYFQGVKNNLSFDFETEKVAINFQINSETHLYELKWILLNNVSSI